MERDEIVRKIEGLRERIAWLEDFNRKSEIPELEKKIKELEDYL